MDRFVVPPRDDNLPWCSPFNDLRSQSAVIARSAATKQSRSRIGRRTGGTRLKSLLPHSFPRVVQRHLGWATALLLVVLCAEAAPDHRAPHIGYIFPAGGEQGTTFDVTVGGQFLHGATNIYVSGDGVTASVIRHVKPLNQKQQGEVRQHLRFRRRCLQLAKAGKDAPPVPEDLPELLDHPWLKGLEEMDLAALGELQAKLFNPKKQLNPQLAETIDLRVTIARNAMPGDRELRVGARAGLTNPLCFQVGDFPESTEQEPNSPTAAQDLVLKAPMVLNGQIFPGDVDRFKLHGQKGQRLLVDARARRLIPYLADAVPGWFQAILTLYDADGKEIAFADDYRFHPDPHLQVEFPADGDYELEIRDAIYRGREDFVYRIAVTEASAGPTDYAPEPNEKEPNDAWSEAESIQFPHQVEGRINRADDVDLFRFEGHADEEIVAEVFARRGLHSPVDALIKLVDAQHNTVAWNDDFMEKDGHLHLGAGLLTHHADAYLQTRLPRDGAYFIRMTDAQGHGGGEYTYRLRMSHPQPDFALRVTPSSLNLPAGRTAPIEVHVMRWDGFEEDIELALVDAPPGFVLSGGRIPAGTDRIRVTLTAPPQKLDEPVALKLEGRSQHLRRTGVPADDTMQAFLWRHLVPAQEFLVSVNGRAGVAPKITRVDSQPVRIAAGETANIRMKIPQRPQLKGVHWELLGAPEGITLGKTEIDGGQLILALKAAEEGVQPGTKENLIIEAVRPRGGKKKNQRISLGVLPAIPLEITGKKG